MSFQPTMQNSTHLHKTLLAALICTCGISAGSNPLGPQVTHGQASMVTTGKLLSVTNTPGTVINWQGFSIAADETTRFIQQNAQSSVLNRIIGQDPSQILGTLQSNGKVFLINPNGIVFGAGARVDVNALVASSLNIGNDDFLTNKLNFSGSAAAGDVVNQGVISTAQGGRVYLISPNVTNSGIINSPGGNVMLAAGHSVRLVDPVDPNLQVVISAPGNQALNVGRVLAEGGNIGMYGALVRQQGLLSANSAVRGENGKIIFKASGDTLLEAGSVTSATGAGRGGEIQVLGERVALRGNAAVDVSGQQGGGTVLVGGDYHGDNTAVQNAKQTTMDRSASIRADAGQVGDGGKVIVWSDQITNARGAISARGGTQAGDGGFVEVSGKKTLDFHAKVDVGANHGHGGTLLLDPASISLIGGSGDGASEGANTFSGGSNPAGNVSFVDPDFAQGGVSNIYQSELEGLGPNTNIVLEATNYIGTTGTFLGNQLTLPNNSNLTRRTRNASTDSNGQEPPIGINLTTSLEVKTQGSGSITLPNLTACIATPTLPGCSVVLPNLTACIATPTLPGCNLTLPNTTACIATPTLPVCNVTLPNLTACIATPTLPGCQVTLPNLTACIATPTLPGCQVVLPPTQTQTN
jgi:filamentous hemagglutinin family protein